MNETKKNVKKSIDEAKNQIPRYADVVKNYQEQALESTGKMTDDYIEAQKSIINSVFDSSIPYYENVQDCTTTGYLQKYNRLSARSVSNIAENISASTRISNDILFGKLMLWDAHSNEHNSIHKSLQE